MILTVAEHVERWERAERRAAAVGDFAGRCHAQSFLRFWRAVAA